MVKKDNLIVVTLSYLLLLPFILSQPPWDDEIYSIIYALENPFGDVMPPFFYLFLRYILIPLLGIHYIPLRLALAIFTSIGILYIIKTLELFKELKLKDKILLSIGITLLPTVVSTLTYIRMYSICFFLSTTSLYFFFKYLLYKERKSLFITVILDSINTLLHPLQGLWAALPKAAYLFFKKDKIFLLSIIFPSLVIYLLYIFNIASRISYWNWLQIYDPYYIYFVLLPFYSWLLLHLTWLDIWRLSQGILWNLYLFYKNIKSNTNLLGRFCLFAILLIMSFAFVFTSITNIYLKSPRYFSSATTYVILLLMREPQLLLFTDILLLPETLRMIVTDVYGRKVYIAKYIKNHSVIYVYPPFVECFVKYSSLLYNKYFYIVPVSNEKELSKIKGYVFTYKKLDCPIIIELSGYYLYKC